MDFPPHKDSEHTDYVLFHVDRGNNNNSRLHYSIEILYPYLCTGVGK